MADIPAAPPPPGEARRLRPAASLWLATITARLPRAFRTFKALLTALVFTVVVVFYVCDSKNVRTSVYWQYFNQVITGNWSSVQPDELHPVNGDYISENIYLLGLLGAIIINFGPLIALISAATSLLARKTEMNLLTAFAERDLNIEVSLVTSVTQAADDLIVPGKREEFLKAVHAAIEDARKDWWGPNLDEEYGPEQAEKMRAKMRDLNLTP